MSEACQDTRIAHAITVVLVTELMITAVILPTWYLQPRACLPCAGTEGHTCSGPRRLWGRCPVQWVMSAALGLPGWAGAWLCDTWAQWPGRVLNSFIPSPSRGAAGGLPQCVRDRAV